MKELRIQTEHHQYPVYIGSKLRFDVGSMLNKQYDRVLIITDKNVEPLYLQEVLQSFPSSSQVSSFTVPASESSKHIDVFYQCHTYAMENGLNRQSLIVALGGGVIGDLAGFVAATYMRGIDYIQVPTTLLAHDSSVGGKVAINHHIGKNMIGCFHQPQAVIYDTDTLSTLSNQEWRSGMAEVVKHAFLADEVLLERCFTLPAFPSMERDVLEYLLMRGIEIKANIVAQDEREAGIRRYLNLGHTLGHALEAEAKYVLSHGEAVAIGIDFALFLSQQHHPSLTFPIERYRKWLQQHQYPTSILHDYEITNLVERMKSDKKNDQHDIRMVTLNEVGDPTTVAYKVNEIKEQLLVYKKEVSRV
ncbi:3-dehydroquinate synthase [Pontibacillus litoralis]|uniref:3-dehydroquinate synthase n=1 Tax=Pontibacillus litoralis JSM 072002 TaxID=1385512 RepID=A0A0A5G4C2_9BACI|nr:3-dehydroquinate synthase [Pontibacillus litoralis]KGX87961.1 3-dehydroquinate synthase [Pontibacillus litoralis JSM 072002]